MDPAGWLYSIPLRLRSLLRRPQVETELDEELRDYLERKSEEGVAQGLDKNEARRIALVELGGIEQRKEDCRDARGVRWLEEFLQDLRYGWRLLRKSPGFSAIVILALALGLGANTALFSLCNSVLLRALPVRDPQHLVILSVTNERSDTITSFSYPTYRALRDKNSVFSGMIAQAGAEMNAGYAGASDKAHGKLVTGNYFETLGVRPWLGRLFTQADDQIPGAHPVAVLSYEYWQRRFGGDPAMVGAKLILNNQPMTVVGITPPGFYGTDLAEVTDIRVPMMMATVFRPFPANRLQNPRHQWMEVLARLKPNLSAAQAEAGLDVLYRQVDDGEIRQVSREMNEHAKRVARLSHVRLLPGSQGFRQLQDEFSHALLILFGITLIILLITCANLANLFLARNAARSREIAMRLALGATRRRLVRQWLTESLLFASLGGGLGLICASWTQSALLHFLPASERMNLGRTALDPAVFGFAFAAAVVTSILFGILPALHLSRGALAPQQGDPRLLPSDMSPRKFRGALVLLQIALSLPLLIGAGLFLHSLRNLKTIQPGFDQSHVVLASLNPSLNGYPPERIRALYDEIINRVRGLPGVRSAALATGVVLSGGWDAISVNVEGYQPRDGEDMNPYSNLVSPRYFATMQTPLGAGRDFNEHDHLKSARVAIINQTMARYFFGNRNPLGKKFGTDDHAPPDMEIIGVVQDAKYGSLKEEPKRQFYVPVAQEPRLFDLTLHVRTGGDTRPLVSLLRQTLQQIDPNVPLYDLTTLAGQLDDSLARDRLITWLSTAFGVLATLLATIGLYGVIAFSVEQRTREIGIRMALGAQRWDVLRLVLRQVALLVFAGVALGAAISLGGARALGSLLYGIETTDPLAFLGAALVLLAAAALAAYPPARRAIHVNPTVALRYE
ncbi:MAG: ABC transporter permease [Chthoniobacterales bacterium]|nr:ABC transporter permease [Chthoniobacterales bacterium]